MRRSPAATPEVPRPLKAALFALALLFPVGYLVIAWLRLGHPFELEWIEGGSLAMARRALEGRALYVAPSLDYVPFNYTPLYYWVSAVFARVLGEGFVPLRAVSILASLASGALIWRLVVLETGRREAGLLAACLFFATYRLAGAWFDVARSDSLQLALLLGGFLVLRADASRLRGPLVAGLLFGLAFLAKQSAAVAVLPLVAYLLLADRVRGAALAATVVVVIGGSTLALDALSGGWYRYYVFQLAGRYPFDPALAARFWTRDLVGPLGIAVLGGLFAAAAPSDAPARPGRGTTWAMIGGLVLAAWSVRAYPAAFDNVLMPACTAAAILGGLGWHAAVSAAQHAYAPVARRLLVFVWLAAFGQFALLLYNPQRQLPAADDARLGAQLLDALRRSPGTVLVPCHDYLTARAGKGEHFHEMAYMAVAKSGLGETETRLQEDLRAALREHRWATIVLDKADWLWDDVERYYEPRVPAFPDDEGFWPVTGMRRRPEVIFVPRADSVRTGG